MDRQVRTVVGPQRTTMHAVVICLVVLALGTVIVTPRYHSAAPTFEAVNTVVGESDIESFDINTPPTDAADLRGDLAASAAAAAASGGEIGGPLGLGPAGGSFSAGEGAGSGATAGFVGLGGGGGGGMDLKGLDSAWKKSGGKLPGGGSIAAAGPPMAASLRRGT